MTDSWLNTIEATFERDFGLQGVRAEYAYGPIPHQAALKVYVPTEPAYSSTRDQPIGDVRPG